MRWSDREAIGLFENIKNGVQVTDNYGRLIWNFTNRGNAWRDREMVGLLTKIRDGVDVVDNYGRMIHNAQNRGGQFGTSLYYLLGDVRTAVAVPVNTVLPAISGTLIQGDTLSATTGTWTNSPTSYAYQWVRLDSSGANPVNIGGATSSTYILVSDDVGNKIQVKVTATNSGGSTSASGSISDVIAPPAPTNSVLPVVTGNNYEGQTLSTTNGTWTNSPTSYTYQWTADGTNIASATSSTYVLATGQAEKVVRCVVTAHNAGGAGSATSAPTATVIGNPITVFGADLLTWYDPSDATTVTKDGSNLVSQLSDKSGNNHHLTATTTKRPTYNATGIFETPAIFFNSGNILSCGSVPFGPAFSVFTLSEFHETAGTGDGYFFSYRADGDAGPYSTHSVIPILTHTGNLDCQYDSNSHPTNSSTIQFQSITNQRLTGGDFRIFGSCWDGTDAQLFVDNQGSTATAYTNALNTPGTISFGNREILLDQLWSAHMGESVVIKRVPTAPERLKLNAWFTRKWSKILIVEGDSIAHEWRLFYDFGHGFIGHDGYSYISTPNQTPTCFLCNRALAGTDFWTNQTICLYDRTASTNCMLPANKYGKKYILVFGFANNLSGSPYYDPLAPQTAQNIADAWKAYCVSAKTAGWDKIVLTTALSRTDAQANDTFRNAFNAILNNPSWNGLVANGGPVDAIANFAGDAIMGVDASPTLNPTYWLDAVHPSQIGHALLEPIFTAAINSV